MPGIVGLVTRNPDGDRARREVRRMLGCMLHDDACVQGTLFLPEQGCYLGWAGHRGSYAEWNPIADDTGDVILVMSGEHFQHGEGAEARRPGDHARWLLRLYEREGAGFVRELNGWFAGVLIDRRRRSIVLFNDRYGIHRTYWHQGDDSFTFATEAKSILSVRPRTRALDTESIGQFLAFGTVFDDRTLFRGVSLLPAASAWTISEPSAVVRHRYFHPSEWAAQPRLEPEIFYRRFHETLQRVLPAYFRSSTGVGLSLTGGLDTRIVTAGMPAGADAHAYTYAGAYRECFDVRVARQVAKATGRPHQVLPLGPDFFRTFGELAEQTVWRTDGTLDLCGTHEVYFSRLARRIAPVRLTGNYGSELLRSVSTFKGAPPGGALFDPEIVAATRTATSSFAAMRDRHPVTFAAFQEIPWNAFGRLAAAQSELIVRSPYMDNEVVALLYQAPPGTRETRPFSWRLISELNPLLGTIQTDMGDRAGARAEPSLLMRMRRAQRYLLFKAEWYYNAGMPDGVARAESMLPLQALAPMFLGSHKLDHYRLWFQHELKGFVREVLGDGRSRSRPYLDRRGHDALVQAHETGRRNTMNDVNKVITLELVQRLLLERRYDEQPEASDVQPSLLGAGAR